MEKSLRRKLKDAKTLRLRTYDLIHCLDRYTLEGYAEIAKHEFIIANSVYKGNRRLKITDRAVLDSAIHQAYKHACGLDELRELARSEPWRAYWCTRKTIFERNVGNWTDEQRTLYAFSYMYDNVYKHPDCPPDNVINDDDLLDGWQLDQKEKYEQRKKGGGDNDNLQGDSVEKFVMVKSKEEAKQVYDKNSLDNRIIIKQRQAALEMAGTLKESELPDIKQDFAFKANEARKKYGR